VPPDAWPDNPEFLTPEMEVAEWQARIRDGSFCLANGVPAESKLGMGSSVVCRLRCWISIFISGNETLSYPFAVKINLLESHFEGSLTRTNSSYRSEQNPASGRRNTEDATEDNFVHA
jgi:hypothetical protein